MRGQARRRVWQARSVPIGIGLAAVFTTGMSLGLGRAFQGAPGPIARAPYAFGAFVLALLLLALIASLLRARAPRLPGAEILLDSDQMVRGARVPASLNRSAWTRALEVGLICTAHFDYRSGVSASAGDPGSGPRSRMVGERTVWEAWQPVESDGSPVPIELSIPPEAPYSYEGDVLSFSWLLVARSVARPHRCLSQAIQVMP